MKFRFLFFTGGTSELTGVCGHGFRLRFTCSHMLFIASHRPTFSLSVCSWRHKPFSVEAARIFIWMNDMKDAICWLCVLHFARAAVISTDGVSTLTGLLWNKFDFEGDGISTSRHSNVLKPAVVDLNKGAPITILWARHQLLEASANPRSPIKIMFLN